MRLAGFAITAVVVAGLSGPAFAQEGSGAGSSQQTATNPPAPSLSPSRNTSSDSGRNWMVSGFIGTNFGSSRNNDRRGVVGSRELRQAIRRASTSADKSRTWGEA